jgi:hypothetical protein
LVIARAWPRPVGSGALMWNASAVSAPPMTSAIGVAPRASACASDSTITTPVSVYGALKCDWSIGGAKPKLTGTKSDFVVKIDKIFGWEDGFAIIMGRTGREFLLG